MNKYQLLRMFPPKLISKITGDDIYFYTISHRCDNKKMIRFRKEQDGTFDMKGMGFTLGSFEFKHQIQEIIDKANGEKWDDVIDMINSGNVVIEDIKSN